MEFKIDTKDTFTVITPAAEAIDAKLADLLAKECALLRQKGSKNFIVDLQFAQTLNAEAIDMLADLNEDCYSSDESLVFTGITAPVMAVIKEHEADLLLNIAPKMIEAVDIVSMEILERDLLSEE